VLASLLLDGGTAAPAAQPRTTVPRGIYAAHTSEQLLDAVLRLCRLLDTPQHIAQLAPLVQREIMYWLLAADDGWKLAQLVTPGTQSQRIGLAIDWLRRHYRQPLDMDDVARAGHMSRSSLDAHFKAVTRMSPLQYQKQLRLLEARRLLVSEAVSAEQAAHAVGYQSASQFSREYARQFGNSPARDARALRAG
jgi:transcriptional regulator GlxA family with amidase domain